MKKIAINKSWGGFGLSDVAFEALFSKKKIEFFKDEAGQWFNSATKDWIDIYELMMNRADPDLISVLEQYKEKANGYSADIAIIEIPEDVDWVIYETDGREWVAERHRTWS